MFPENHPFLTFTKKFTFHSVPAKTTLWATVEITSSSICNFNQTKRSTALQTRSSGGGCVSAYMQWSAKCGDEDRYQSAPIAFVKGAPCPGGFPFGGAFSSSGLAGPGELGWMNFAGSTGYGYMSLCDPQCQRMYFVCCLFIWGRGSSKGFNRMYRFFCTCVWVHVFDGLVKTT